MKPVYPGGPLTGDANLPGNHKPIWWDDEHAFVSNGDDSSRVAALVLAAAERRVVYVDRLSQDPHRVADLPVYGEVRRPTRWDPDPPKALVVCWQLGKLAELIDAAREEYINQFDWREEAA